MAVTPHALTVKSIFAVINEHKDVWLTFDRFANLVIAHAADSRVARTRIMNTVRVLSAADQLEVVYRGTIPRRVHYKRPTEGSPEEGRRLLEEAKSSLETSINQRKQLEEQLKGVEARIVEIKKEAERNANRVVEVQIKRGPRKVKTLKEIFHREFRTLLDLAKARENIFIYGPTGCGKSFVCEQLARALHLKFYFISCTAGMSEGNIGGRSLPAQPDPEELMKNYKELVKQRIDKGAAATLAAAMSSGFSYIISEFVKAYEQGGVFLLDEMDAADSNVLLFINAALANGQCAVPNRPHKPYAKRHPDFICVGAANTPGTGGERMHSARVKLDGATLDRFPLKVLFEYDRELEKQVCLDKDGNFDAELGTMLWKVREAIDAHRLERAMSTRFMVTAAKMKHQYGWSHSKILKHYTTGWRRDEITKMCDHSGVSI